VHRGTRHGLGDEHQLVGIQQRHRICRQSADGCLNRSAQHTQAGLGDRHQAHGLAIALKRVVSGAQESEMLVFEPAQEINALLLVDAGQR